MKVEAILIDIGGPILDEDHEYEAWDRYLASLLRAEGIAVEPGELSRRTLDAIRRCERNPRIAAMWELLRPDLGRFARLRDDFREFQRRHLLEEYRPRLRPGVKGVLEELSKKYRLALAGNQPAWIKDYLREEGILGYFEWRYVSEEMRTSKPDTLFFRMILGHLGIGPGEAVMVGDRLDHDVLPAKLLGMRAIRVLVGPYREQVPISPLHCPDGTIRSLLELPDLLAGWDQTSRG